MDRAHELLKYVQKDLLGIEFGPWYCPMTPKSGGYRSLVLDVFDAPTLRRLALENSYIPQGAIVNIEEVDLLGTAATLEALVRDRGQLGEFDYVVSSHNIEHLPNPIQFLQGCGKVLKKGGYISLAIPDRRVCYDYFRPLSTIGDWIEAHLENRTRPTFAQLFEAGSLFSPFVRNGVHAAGFTLQDNPANLAPPTGLRREYDLWMSRLGSFDDEYHDTHCWTFTPTSFKLILEAAHFLQLSPFQVVEVSGNNGLEFYAHLRNVGYAPVVDDDDPDAAGFYQKRYDLLQVAHSEASLNNLEVIRLRSAVRQAGAEKAAALAVGTRASFADSEQRRLQSDHVAALEARIAALESSSSWRLTAPLRWMKSTLNRRNSTR